MPTPQEICVSCPLDPSRIEEGGEELCAALGGSNLFAKYLESCYVVSALNEMDEHPQNFAELYRMFALLRE